MNIPERIKMVKAMEFLARQINDEDVFYFWLGDGVADGDIPYGDLSVPADDTPIKEDAAYWYCESDRRFAELMGTFVRRMKRACDSGGLYCDGVVSD